MVQKGSFKKIDVEVLGRVIADLPGTFSTVDVSDDRRMADAHPVLVAHSHYKAFVGRAISAYRGQLGVAEIRKATSRGSIWEKRAGVARKPRVLAVVPVPAQTGNEDLDLGPQHHGDSAFTAQMRLHQSWYRATALNVPCGTGPTSTSHSHYGNMLRPEDGARGLNFVSSDVAEVAKERVAAGGGAVEPFRLFHNMLSSQPMCFNIFGPLIGDLRLATCLVGMLLPGEVAEVTAVHIEYGPQPAPEYLDDRTAFDAFIEYRRPDGGRVALGIETKLTEPFSQRHYDKQAYRRWMKSPRSPWRANVADSVADVEHNQLWRDHLLAVAVRDHPGSPYVDCKLMLVRHPEDRDCRRVVEGYRQLLVPGDQTFIDLPLDELLERWEAAGAGAHHDSWLSELRRRYLDLYLSAI